MRGSPGLHDHAPGNDHQVFSPQHAAERRELAAGFPADLCGAARGRRMLLRIHVKFKSSLGETLNSTDCWIALVIRLLLKWVCGACRRTRRKRYDFFRVK